VIPKSKSFCLYIFKLQVRFLSTDIRWIGRNRILLSISPEHKRIVGFVRSFFGIQYLYLTNRFLIHQSLINNSSYSRFLIQLFLIISSRAVMSRFVAPPASLIQLEIPEEFRTIGVNNKFLLHDSGVETENRRMLIFGSEESQMWLNYSTAVFAVGTFKAASPIFAQLYVIIGLNEVSAFPCLFALLPGKSQSVYEPRMHQV